MSCTGSRASRWCAIARGEPAPRHRPDPGHHRAQARPGAARLPGLPRPAHRPPEPAQADGGPRARRRGRDAGRSRCCCCSSTSTASRPTTTPSATRRATRCCRGSAAGSGARSRAAASPTAWAATSSACSARSASTARRRWRAPPRAALPEHGEGFSVTASYGSAILPVDAADLRRGACARPTSGSTRRKGTRRASAGRQATDALLGRSPSAERELGTHLHDVTDLCQARRRAAERLRGGADAAAPGRRAARRRQGRRSPTPSSTSPRRSTRRSGLHAHRTRQIGERILSAAPALDPGREDRPLDPRALRRQRLPRRPGRRGDPARRSRIIAVCDAYDAMISDRPYRTAMSVEGACSELRRNAGTQFDPRGRRRLPGGARRAGLGDLGRARGLAPALLAQLFRRSSS